jgi:nucleoid-associated protein EbfC
VNEDEDFLPGGFGELLRQAQEMQEQLAEAQHEAAGHHYEGKAGGGAVRVSVDGAMQFHSVSISPEAVDSSDVAMLEDLVLAALHDAVGQVRAGSFGAMGAPGGAGLDLGGLLGGAGGLGGLADLMGPLGEMLGGLMGTDQVEDEEAGGFLAAGELEEPGELEAPEAPEV